MKAALTTILILASLTANAGRFYYYYYYEGPSNYGGLYLMMILIGML